MTLGQLLGLLDAIAFFLTPIVQRRWMGWLRHHRGCRSVCAWLQDLGQPARPSDIRWPSRVSASDCGADVVDAERGSSLSASVSGRPSTTVRLSQLGDGRMPAADADARGDVAAGGGGGSALLWELTEEPGDDEEEEGETCSGAGVRSSEGGRDTDLAQQAGVVNPLRHSADDL